MLQHRLIVAGGFRIVGWVVGLPAVLLALALGVGAATVGAGPGPQTPQYLSVTHYGIVGLLNNAATWVGGGLAILNELAAWVMALLAVLAFVVALLAGLTWLVGRGLKASATWARVLGGLMIALLSFGALLAMTVLTGKAALVDAGLLALFAYILWVLGWRFKTPARATGSAAR